jgi:hypothetical protein
MTSNSENGAASNGAMPPDGVSRPGFDPASVTQFWLSSGARLTRSGEAVWRGVTAIARLEAEFVQHVLQRGMAGLQPPGLGTRPDAFLRARLEETGLAAERLIATMGKIGDECRETMSEVAEALFEGAGPAAPPSPAAAPVVWRQPAAVAAAPDAAVPIETL